MAREQQDRGIKTTETVFDIIEYLREAEKARLSEVADEVGKAPSTVHDHLATLENKEYVVRDGDFYRLGLKFLHHGSTVRDRVPILEEVTSVLEYVAETTGETAWFIVEEHGRCVYVKRVLGERAVQTPFTIGARRPIYLLASGKAILAHLPEERIDEILEMCDLESYTSNSTTSPELIREELEQIREDGVAFNDSESIKGMRGVASAIQHDGTVRGAICVAGPANRIRNERFREELPDIVRGATNELELKLSYV